MYKKIPVEEATGRVIAHDMTRIVPGETKGPAFKKGHIIREEDIPFLKSMGKEHIYILEIKDGFLHEDDAALKLTRLTTGSGITFNEPSEGKVILTAEYDGLFKANSDLLFEANMVEDILISSRHTNTPVKEGAVLAGIRVNPLVIEEENIKKVEEILAGAPLFEVKPFVSKKVGIVVTGNEVYTGKIEDRFVPVMKRKFKRWGGKLLRAIYVPDDKEKITRALLQLKDEGAEVLITGGGMSVDPDDVTPSGIRETGARVVTFGVPVLPGNKLMLAYLGNVPILGLPACVIFDEITAFDLIYPRILTGERVTRSELVKLGHGGLCLHCSVCSFPDCSLGKV